ncbi:MAG: EAL domain-containing protein [Thiobacillus sp.]|nr:EAL domain-containing protein [Thiobacillus sp.]
MVSWRDTPRSDYYQGKVEAVHRDVGHILLVEDDVRFAQSMQRLLSGAGFDVTVTHTGSAARAELAGGDFHLALVDMNLPDMSGHEIIQEINDKKLNTAAIVVSGETEIDAAINALRAGALDFVRKPPEPALLLHAVRRAIRQRCLEREHLEFQQRLHRSERLHRYLVDKSPDIILMMDLDARVTFVNNRLGELLGIESESIVGRHFVELVFEHDRERAQYAFNSAKLTETSKHLLEFRLKSNLDHSGFRHFELLLSAADLEGEEAGGNPVEDDHFYMVARDITVRREAEERARFHANHDALTGLPNRNLFRDRLGLALVQARRNNERLGVLFLNIDRFKSVNDLYGHAQADILLNRVTERIQRCLRGGDTLARFGGDEFLLLNTGIKHDDEVLAIVARINEELEEHFKVSGKQVFLSMSAGIAIFPEHGDNADALIRHANIALYHGRISGSSSHTFFMQEMGKSTDHRLTLEQDLRQALDQDQFELYYQPQMGLKNRHIKGVEALVRWNHPRLGLLPPGEFLPVAEESGFIEELGEWVIKKAFKTLQKWEQRGIAPDRVAINISPRHLERHDFVEQFTRLMKEFNVTPLRVEIELTENLFIRDPGAMVQKLQTLAAHGVMVAIDDFGTQYSSLSYLQKFPIHTLKIDKSFVWEIDREYRQHAIIKAIISIAHGLGLNLIAEGVETDEQLKFLEGQGCDEIQGYLVSRPLPLDALEPLLEKQREPLRLVS